MMQRLLLLERCIDLISAQFLTSEMKKRDFTIDGVIAGLHKLAENNGFVINHDYKYNGIYKIGLIIILKADRTDYIDFTISDTSFSLIHNENTRGRVENFRRAERKMAVPIETIADLIRYLKDNIEWTPKVQSDIVNKAFAETLVRK